MHVVVIGGGIVGLTTAYHLARRGAEVTVVDARAASQGASEVNAGWVCPGESVPVPGPGLVWQSIKWMLRKDSPLYIRPSLQPTFLRFMFSMWRACNARAQRAGFEAHLRLAQDTVPMFDEYTADGIDFEMHTNGLLMAFTQKENLEHHLDNLDLSKQFGLEPTALRGDDVRVQEPQLTDAVVGGIFLPQERHLDPGALTQSLVRRLREMGAQIVEHAPVDGIETTGDRVTAVRSGSRRFEGDAVVLATGAWTGQAAKLFGTTLPIRPGKGYCLEVDPLPLRSAVNLSDAKVATTPFKDRLRLAGTMEFGGLDEDINQVRVDAILRAPATYYRDWKAPTGPVTPRAGMRPMSSDGLPVIGELGTHSNAFVTAGHGMMGVTLGPASAEALTEYILTGRKPSTLEPFSAKRFS